MDNCQHCNHPNEGGWFYCRECGHRAHPPKFTTNSWMRGSLSGRTDVEVNSMSLQDSTDKMANNTMNDRLKQLGVKPL
tara:strand:+ start:5822 stop:6055 length:234 start_codon:yes stop_codon:yes gene_type:complete